MKKALVAASVASMIDQFNMPNIDILLDLGYEVHVACNFEVGSSCSDERVCEFKATLSKLNVVCHQIDFSRKITKLGANFKAYRQMCSIIKKNAYDLIHCHSPIGGIITRLAAKEARKKGCNVMYTAHGFHFYEGAPKQNWLIYYPIERFFSRYTDVLITINAEDLALAEKKLHAKKNAYIPGVGIRTDNMPSVDRGKKRNSIGVPDDAFMILSAGELNVNKNHSIVIRALAQSDEKNVHYAIAGKGALCDELLSLSSELGVSDRVHLLGFRTDMRELYMCADAFAFPSYREGLGLAALEAMAASLPLMVADNRGTREYARSGRNAFVCAPDSVEGFADAIKTLANDPELCRSMGIASREDALRFDIENINSTMYELYANEKCVEGKVEK